jgi:uncharacterized protein YdhG (YjbR/CyaY superfamily)
MTSRSGDRAAHFPLIEKKYGKPVAHWFRELKQLPSEKYADQLGLLIERHGFSRAHANALVMFHRGSTSSRRHASPKDYFVTLDPRAAKTLRAIFRAVQAKHRGLELVMAWNQPMLRKGDSYVVGASVAKKHITLNPFSKQVMDAFRPELLEFDPLKHTFKVPVDWKVNASLLQRIARARLAEIREK